MEKLEKRYDHLTYIQIGLLILGIIIFVILIIYLYITKASLIFMILSLFILLPIIGSYFYLDSKCSEIEEKSWTENQKELERIKE